MSDTEALRRELDEKLDQLPEDQLREVLALVDSLRRKRFSPNPSIEERIMAHVDEVPDEAWDEVPADASEHLDQYLYDTPET